MKAFLYAAIAAASIVPALPAHALDASLSWQAPTQYTDGIPIAATAVITYKIYNKSGLLNTTGATSFFVGGAPSNLNCWTVTAIVDGAESVKSAEACKRAPKEPTNVAVK